jgi:hypothetical protein
VRAEFAARFTARRMAQDYVAIYRKVAFRAGALNSGLLEAAD